MNAIFGLKVMKMFFSHAKGRWKSLEMKKSLWIDCVNMKSAKINVELIKSVQQNRKTKNWNGIFFVWTRWSIVFCVEFFDYTLFMFFIVFILHWKVFFNCGKIIINFKLSFLINVLLAKICMKQKSVQQPIAFSKSWYKYAVLSLNDLLGQKIRVVEIDMFRVGSGIDPVRCVCHFGFFFGLRFRFYSSFPAPLVKDLVSVNIFVPVHIGSGLFLARFYIEWGKE